MQPEFGMGTLENIPAVYDWLHANVLGKTGKELQQLRAQFHAAAQIQQVQPPLHSSHITSHNLHGERRTGCCWNHAASRYCMAEPRV